MQEAEDTLESKKEEIIKTESISLSGEEKNINMEAPTPQKPKKNKKKLWLGLIFIFSFLLLMGIVGSLQAGKVITKFRETEAAGREVYTAVKNQDLVIVNENLVILQEKLSQTQASYEALKWTGYLPFAGSYYRDGDHLLQAAVSAVEAGGILLSAVEPYADVLGFKGQGSFMGGTAEERIVKVVETIDKVTPQLDQVSQKLEAVNSELNLVNPEKYDNFVFQGKNISAQIVLIKNLASDALFTVTQARPAIEKLPKIMGVDAERKYMVLFQNDAELRATGGFLTAYAILRVEKGKVYQEKSEDIYALDAKFTSKIEAPEIIKKYLPLVYRLNLRDSNLSPDFKVSMDTFSHYYQKIPNEPEIDGIIAVDTQILRDIIEVLGPIEVPGYGTYSTETDPRCDCPQVVYALEELADRPTASLRENRKAILAPMLQAILTKSYASPKQIWPSLFTTLQKNISQKHLLFYLFDPQEQSAAERINVAGRIAEFNQDYLHINDTNFAGAKSNMFTTQKVEQVYEVDKSGAVVKTVTVKYQNPYPASNCNLEAGELCLNGVLRDFVRVYVPLGSELIEALGSENPVETKEDLGKTVFEAFFVLQPQSQAKLVFRYRLPYKAEAIDKVLIQKQPGTGSPQYTITTNEELVEFALETDKTVKLSL